MARLLAPSYGSRKDCRVQWVSLLANNGMQLTGLLGAPNQLVSVRNRAGGHSGLGSPALQLMPGR